MKRFFNSRQILALLLVTAVFMGVYGCTANRTELMVESESLREYTSVDTYVVTEPGGETVTATDEEGSTVTVTETVVLTLTEKVTVTVPASSSAASSPTKSTTVRTTTRFAPGTTIVPGNAVTSTTKKPASGTTAKVTTSASKTTTASSGGSSGAVTTKPVTTTKPTTTVTVPSTKYVPVSELSPKFSYLSDTDKVSKFAASSKLADFGMSEAVQTAFKKDQSKWRSFTIAVNFANTTGSDITVYGLKTDSNGKSGVYIGVSGECEYGFVSTDKSEHTVYFHVLVSDSALDEPKIISAIKGMDVSLSYSRTPADGNDIPNRQYAEIK